MNNWKRIFAIIWTGQLFSILTSAIVNFAIILWLSLETGSAEVLAWAAIAALLPQSVLGLFSGVYIDRWDRKKVMILSDSFIAFCTLILGILFYIGKAETLYIYILLALRSVGSAFHGPAMQASIPLLAPEAQLMRVAGINQMIQSLCNIAGPALGALLITQMSMTYVLLLDVAGALIACISLAFVKIPSPRNRDLSHKPNLFKEIKEAYTAVSTKKKLVWLFIFSILATFFIMPVSVLFPLMTLDHFAGNEFKVSLIEIVWGVGSLMGGVALSIRPVKINRVILINSMYIVLGLTFFFSGLLPSSAFYVFAALTLVGGIAGSVYYSSFTTILQIQIEPEMLGRIFSTFMSLSLLPSMLGLLFTGYIADNIGLTNAFIISGILITAIGISSFFMPSLLKYGSSRVPEY